MPYLSGSTEAWWTPWGDSLALREIEAGVGALNCQGSLVILPCSLLSCVKGAQPQAHILAGVPDLCCILPPRPQAHSSIPGHVSQQASHPRVPDLTHVTMW